MSRVIYQAHAVLGSNRGPSHVVVEIPGDDFVVVDVENSTAIISCDSHETASYCADGLSNLKALRKLRDILESDDDSIIAIYPKENLNGEDRSLFCNDQIKQKIKIELESISQIELTAYSWLCESASIPKEISDEMRGIQNSSYLRESPAEIIVKCWGESTFGLEEDDECEESVYYLAIKINYDSLGLISALDISVLKNDFVFEAENMFLSDVMLNIVNSPLHSLFIESEEELIDWMPVIETMPCFAHTHIDAQRIYVFEGGPVLESLMHTSPWLVCKGQDGLAQPLRIVSVPDDQLFGEIGMRIEAATQAGHYLAEVLSRDAAYTRQKSPMQAFQKVAGTTLASWGLKLSEGPEMNVASAAPSPAM